VRAARVRQNARVTELTRRLGLNLMRPRDPREPGRASSPLEAFFDLVFVVAVSLASGQLHHAETGHDPGQGILMYGLVFFAIWWAWMNFTWFATAFDTDDWWYRVVTLVQMGGALVMAAGAGPAMGAGDMTVMIVGYVIMRLALVSQWLRAAAASPELRGTAVRYAIGVAVVQALWMGLPAVPRSFFAPVCFVLILAELAVPVLAERHRQTPWHAGHIAERYGLFTLIVLGESVLASTNAVVDALGHAEHIAPLLAISACGLVLAFGMWWIYFSREHDEHITTLPKALRFGYGHYAIFAAAGAFSAGIEVAIDVDTNEAGLAAAAAAATVTVPVALFVLGTWFITLRHTLSPLVNAVVAGLAVAIGLAAFAPASLALAAAGVVAIVVVLELPGVRARAAAVSAAEDADAGDSMDAAGEPR